MIQSEDVIQYNWIPRLVSSCTKGLRLHLKWSDFPNNQPVRVFFFSPWGPRGSDVSDGPKQCSTRICTNHTLYRSPFGSGSFGFVIVSLSRDSLKGICTGPTCFSKTWTLIPTRSTLSSFLHHFIGLNFTVADIFFCLGTLSSVFPYCSFRMLRLVVLGALASMAFGMNLGGLNLGASKLTVTKFC